MQMIALLVTHKFVEMLYFVSYYMRGYQAKPYDFIDPKFFAHYEGIVKSAKEFVKSSKHPELPVWNGETSDASHGGKENVTDRFISGFLYVLILYCS